jgi:hypothetical protein
LCQALQFVYPRRTLTLNAHALLRVACPAFASAACCALLREHNLREHNLRGALSGAHGRQVDIEHERCRGGGTRLKGPHGPSTEVPFRDAPMPFLSERQQPATSRQVCRQTHRASSHIIRSAAQDRCHNQPIYRAPGAAYPTMCVAVPKYPVLLAARRACPAFCRCCLWSV